MLGQHFGGDEAGTVHMAGGDHRLVVAEQVRQDAGVFHRHNTAGIDHREGDLERVLAALDRASLDHAAKAERFCTRRPGFDLAPGSA